MNRDLPERALAGGVLLTIHRLSQGGADRVAMLLANGFAAAGLPTAVAVLRGGGEGERAMLDLLDDAVTVVTAGAAMGSRHLELVRGLGFIRRLSAVARPAVVMASSSNMGLITGLSARGRRGPKYVMKLTNPVIRPADRTALKRVYRRRLYGAVFAHYDKVLVLSDAERGELEAMYPGQRGRLKTVANPYVTEAMLAVQPVGRGDEPPIILSLARMMPQKRLDRLLQAFALVRGARRLVIVGDGPERPALEALARELGVADRVAMPGFVEDVVPWLRRAALFVLSSDYEGLPAVVLEALAANVPVVSTDCFPGARVLLAAERCAVVVRDDPAALARAIEASLAGTTAPTNLRDLARGYSVEAGIASHLTAIAPLIG